MALSVLRRGMIAGAAGTTVLNAVTYLDIVVRGRPASEMPRKTVQKALERFDLGLSGDRDQRERRESALGALSGIVTGLGVGVGVCASRSLGLRLSPLTGTVVTTAAAMAATDGPAALLGVTDPRTWSSTDWVGDVVPHLAFAVATHQVAARLEAKVPELTTPGRPSTGLLARCLLLGIATGSRSSLGIAAAAYTAASSPATTAVRRLSAAAVLAELAADKHPRTPSRLEREGLGPRFLAATVGAAALASRENAVADLPVAASSVGAAIGAFGGAAWREAALLGPVPTAVVEDVVALGLAGLACRRGR